eukprot:CCRYP_017693-RA/>CCRYP_017693-RA protein AED:0.25 eAED:0.25 QI:111/1/1/1/1/1/2/397/497
MSRDVSSRRSFGRTASLGKLHSLRRLASFGLFIIAPVLFVEFRNAADLLFKQSEADGAKIPLSPQTKSEFLFSKFSPLSSEEIGNSGEREERAFNNIHAGELGNQTVERSSQLLDSAAKIYQEGISITNIDPPSVPNHRRITTHQLHVLRDITPPPPRKHMFCAAVYDKPSNQYLALASNRPAIDGMTAYRLDADWSISPSSDHVISEIGDWEDPRLLMMDTPSGEQIVLAFFQRMARPFAVARWFVHNNTMGPISELGVMNDDGSIIREGTKNWSPLVYDGVLHFLISSFPTIVLRCETSDYLTWDVCVPSISSMTSLGNIQSFQSAMILRGGSNFIPYPDKGSNIFVGFLHSRTNQNGCSVLGSLFLHVPILFVLLRADDGTWHPIYVSHAPSFIPGHNMSESLQQLMNHAIQDPVSFIKFDVESGDAYLTLNMADDNGRCAVGLFKNLLPLASSSTENNWILNAAKNYKMFNATKAQEDNIASLMRLCQERYGP